MWEDTGTGSKWVMVNRCFFPNDLPEAVGCPCAPETSEVSYFGVWFHVLFLPILCFITPNTDSGSLVNAF